MNETKKKYLYGRYHFSKEKTIPRDCINFNGSFKCSAHFFYCNFSESLFIKKTTR